MTETLTDFLARRRSVKPDMLSEPAPTPAELNKILTIAARVPDHKKLVPWRFIIIEGEGRRKFGDVIARVCEEDEDKPLSSERLKFERGRFLRAPLVIAVIARLTDQRGVPHWEQTLSAGAAAFNLCLAANSLGYGTAWLTEWMAYNEKIARALGLADHEKVVGFVHIGTANTPPSERVRPYLDDIVSTWTPDSAAE